MVDVRPTRLLSGMHVFSISAEVGMRTTKTGRRAPPFTALGVRFRHSCRCGFCAWPPTCGSCPSSDGWRLHMHTSSPRP
eukprot:scaffold84127_cov27-Phaeocystis_antarctica.AAC.2